MKKLFTILMLCFAVFAVNAQFILQEDFENGLPTGWTNIDNDGDTYSWDADYWPALGDFGNNGSTGVIASASYINDIGALHPDNWLITPAITLEAGSASILNFYAGNYGYDEPLEVLVSTTGATVAAFTDPAIATYEVTSDVSEDGYTQYSVNLSAYAGQTIYIAFVHRNCTDNYWLFLDDITIESITTPELTVNPDNIDFGTVVVGQYADQTCAVNAFLLNGAITATTAAPFSVSADGNTFGTTASLASTGGALYVRYSATAAGSSTGSVNLVSGSLNATIALSGSGIDCSAEGIVPFTEGFEYTGALPSCYTFVYGNNNPSVNPITAILDTNTTGYAVRFSSYNSGAPYDQYMISMPIQYSGTSDLNFSIRARNAGYGTEVFALGYSTTTADVADFTWGETYSVTSGSPYADYRMVVPANTQYVAVHYFSNYAYYLCVDDLSVEESEPEIIATPAALDFGIQSAGAEVVKTVNVVGASLNSNITATTVAPYTISVDSINFDVTATLPSNGSTLYVKYAPIATSIDSATIVLSNAEADDITVTLVGQGHLCENITSLPFTDNFDLNTIPPMCWTTTDETLLGNGTIDQAATDAVTLLGATGAIIISPEIEANTNPMWAAFDYATYAGFNESVSVSPSTFRVGYSTTTNDYSAFTWGETVTAVDDADFINYREFIPAGAKYVAIEGNSIGTFLYYGFFEYDNWVILNNFTLTEAEPEIVANPATIDFGGIEVGSTATEDATITGVMLTDSISVTTTAPFAISLDGTAFTTEIAMAPAGATLYVQYAPTAAGTANGTVTLTSGTISATITLTGNAADCSGVATLPFTEDFEDELDACWKNIDADGDGKVWFNASDLGLEAFNGTGAYVSASYENNFGPLTPENWLITPAIAIPEEGAHISWYVAAQDASYPEEYYQVMVATGNSISDFSTVIFSETLTSGDWEERNANFDGFAGQTVYVAFVHMNSSDNYMMKIDDINITAGTVGIEENEASSFRVFPNPATNMINVEAQGYEQYQLVNMLGQTVSSNSLNNGTAQINVSNLSNGVYFVRLINGNNVETIKVVKK